MMRLRPCSRYAEVTTNFTMKKLLLLVLAGLSLFVSPVALAGVNRPVTISAPAKQTIVYTTKTGSKYHISGCRYLKQSKIKTTRKEAVANGYGACKVCKP